MVITSTTEIVAVEMAGCGHVVYLTREHNQRMLDNRGTRWFCTVCGRSNHYVGEGEADRLRRQLASTRDMLDTARQQRDITERRLRAQKGVTTRIKNRVSKGVCPCCNRTFRDLAQHMATKHPDYAEKDTA